MPSCREWGNQAIGGLPFWALPWSSFAGGVGGLFNQGFIVSVWRYDRPIEQTLGQEPDHVTLWPKISMFFLLLFLGDRAEPPLASPSLVDDAPKLAWLHKDEQQSTATVGYVAGYL